MNDRFHGDEAGERVLMLAPTSRDAGMARDILAESGFAPQVFGAYEDFARCLGEGAGAVILMEEFFATRDAERLLEVLERQPAWSSLPLIVLSAAKGQPSRAQTALKSFANIVLLERPARIVTLVSAIQAALAARRRQYELRDSIEAMRRTAEERDRLYREAEAARAEAEAADHRKNEFLAMLAHELRNPLSPIGTASELLSRTVGKDSRAHTAIEMIKRQVTQLTRLVDDLLDVSRITQGRIQLRQRPVELAGVVAQAVETAEPQLRERRHRLSMTASSYEPLYVMGDFARLVQCVGNILTNAIKYTEPGGEISIRTGADESHVSIEVADTGVGISADLLPRVFDLFVQSERTLDRSQGGLGIGLAVVKRLVEMHQGEVSARSDGHGRGTTLEIRLPRIARPTAAPMDGAPFEAEPRRVLIVDDNADSADSLSMLLEFQGHATHVAYGARDALACIEDFKPEVGLLDIGLPEMDGYELAKRLRAMSAHPMRLIALTGYGQTEDAQRAIAAGFDHHLVKPVDLQALERALAGLSVVAR